MSSAQQDQVYTGDWDADYAEYDGLSVYACMGAADGIYSETVAGAIDSADNIIRLAYANSSPEVAGVVDRTFTLIKGGLEAGQISPAGGAWAFLRWLGQRELVPVITAGLLASGAIAGQLVKYAEQRGWRPKPAHGEHHPAPAHHLTHAQAAVAGAALKVGSSTVTAPGLTKAEASAISRAIGISYRDVLRVQAAVLDALLPAMRPGQVPEALTDLMTAARVLEHQVALLRAEVGTKAGGHVAGELHGAQEALHGLDQAVHTLAEQMGAKVGSQLSEDIDKLKAGQTATDHALTHVSEAIGTLAPLAALHDLRAEVTTTVEQLGLAHSSALDTALNGVEHTVQVLKLAAQDAVDCCEANAAVTKPIHAGGATPSLLHQLGNLLKRAFELGFLATLVETAVTVLDAPLEVSAVMADTSTIATWATQAAGAITADLSWLGGAQ